MADFQFRIKSDTSQAEADLKKLSTAANQVDQDVKEIDFSALGVSMMDAAKRVGGGMLGLVKSSSDLAESQNFVKQIFGEASTEIDKWSKTADRSALLSQRAALQGAASLGIFGQRINLTGDDLAHFSIGLVELAADMASVANTDVEQAVVAIAAAMRNEYEPIRKYGAVLNEVVLKKRILQMTGEAVTGQMSQEQKIIAVNAELFEQLGFAIGDVEATFGQFANQQRYASAQMENLKAAVGDGLRPAFINMLQVSNDVLGVLRKIPEPIMTIGTTAAMTATGFVGLAGGLLFAAAQGQKAIKTFQELSASLNVAAEGGSKMAMAARGFGPWVAGLAAVTIGSKIALDSLNDLRDVTSDTGEAIGQFKVAAAAGPKVDTYKTFLDVMDQINRKVTLSDIFTTPGRRIALAGAEATVSIEVLQEAIDTLAQTSSPEALIGLRDTMVALKSTLPEGSREFKDVATAIEYLESKIRPTVQQLQAQGQALDPAIAKEFGDATLTGAAAQEEFAKAAEEAAKAQEELMKTLQDDLKPWTDYAKKVGEVEAKFSDLEAKTDALGDALGEVMGTGQAEQNMLDIRNAAYDMVEAFKDEDGNINGMLMDMSSFNQVGRDNLAAVEDLASAVGNELTRAYQDSGGSMTEMMRKQSELRDEFVYTATAAGVPTEKVKELADQIFATPEEIAIAVILSGQEEALKKIETLGITIDDIPKEHQTQYMALIDKGDYIGAWKLAQQVIDEQGALKSFMITEASPVGPYLSESQTYLDANPLIVPANPTIHPIGPQLYEVQRGVDGTPIKVPLAPLAMPTSFATKQMQAEVDDLNAKVIPVATSTESTTQGMQGKTKDLTTDINPVPKATSFATNTMQGWTADLTTRINAQPTSTAGPRGTMQSENNWNPLGINTNAKAGDTGGARNSMQGTMNSNPLSIEVHPRMIIDNAWRNTVAGLRASIPIQTTAPPSNGAAAQSATGMAVPPPVAAGYAAPHFTPPIINMNITMPLPVGADETRVVAALKRYTKNHGALPLKLAGVYA